VLHQGLLSHLAQGTDDIEDAPSHDVHWQTETVVAEGAMDSVLCHELDATDALDRGVGQPHLGNFLDAGRPAPLHERPEHLGGVACRALAGAEEAQQRGWVVAQDLGAKSRARLVTAIGHLIC